MLPVLVLRVAPTVMAQESCGGGKGMTRNPVVGVVAVLPPTLFSVSPPSLQLAIQFMLTVWLEPFVRVTAYETVAGLLIVLITVQLAFACGVPVALQEPTKLALAVVAPTI